MKTIGLYAIAAALYVIGGTLMKYSRGLTRLLPAVALVVVFSAGALIQAWAMRREPLGPSYVGVLGLEALLALLAGYLFFSEQVNLRVFSGMLLVVIGIVVLRLP
ncbi:MAG TPA: SMR family transporter [Candidatus Limnocylindrales bacterium]|nr:SMR family transporter [Candidatus Limnocylindrales bacterium]